MKVVPLEGMTLTIPELVEMAKGEAIILTRDGQPRSARERNRAARSGVFFPQTEASSLKPARESPGLRS